MREALFAKKEIHAVVVLDHALHGWQLNVW